MDSKNPFIASLLTLQQDGRESISGPSNWSAEPLLEVKTKLHDTVESLTADLVDRNTTAPWHFFVGSPGNGKSAAVGLLVRSLKTRGHAILDSESRLPIESLTIDKVPYRLDVHRPGEPYPYLLIAQDASVLPDPYDSEANPASALVELLHEACRRGVALVVCTNRGVVERAFSQCYLEQEFNTRPWFRALRAASGSNGGVDFEFENGNKNSVYKDCAVTVTALDKQSLVLRSDTLEQLLDVATAAEKWQSCDSCSAKPLCPFRANRDWLATPALRQNFLRLVKHAELYDGQVIVLREALALVSLILAGCPHDYSSSHPCDWVATQIDQGRIFNLMSRRIYMVLFASYTPFGLHDNSFDAQRQVSSFAKIEGKISDASKYALAALKDPSEYPSTDVGARRLLSREGTFSALDPFRGVLPPEFIDRWGETWLALQDGAHWASELERTAYVIWEDILRAAAALNESDLTIYRSVLRWITAYTYRAGALVENTSNFGADLDVLSEILSIDGTPTHQQADLLSKIEQTLKESLHPAGEGLKLSPSTTLAGTWADAALAPQLVVNSDGALTATLKFGQGEETVPLNTRAFIWLKRRAEMQMDAATFPREFIETARDAMLRIAVASEYDMQDDVQLRITRPDRSVITIKRARKGLYVND